MSLFHAVVWTDHQSAQVLQFDSENVEVHKVKAHSHPTAQHRSGVRTEHEFFGALCDSLEGITEVLVTGLAHRDCRSPSLPRQAQTTHGCARGGL